MGNYCPRLQCMATSAQVLFTHGASVSIEASTRGGSKVPRETHIVRCHSVL